MNTTRDSIGSTADTLFYQRGFDHTSFADIAKQVAISRGNFYHHFKSKDQILAAVIEKRLFDSQQMLASWQQQSTNPQQCIECYIRILQRHWCDIRLYGCPLGSLSQELAKLEHPLREQAKALFELFRTWLAEQFRLLGFIQQADHLALDVLAWSQGIATLANALGEREFVDLQVEQKCQWLARLCATTEPC